jgi:hypothetical protein
MLKVCGSKFYSIRDILKNGGFIYPTSNWSLRRYVVRFSREKEEIVIAELKCVAVLENANKRRAWIYEVDGKAFLIIYEAKPFNNHKRYHIVVEKTGDPPISLIKFGVVKLFENQVLTIEGEEGVGEFIKKLLNKGWLIRFPSGSQEKAGY